MINENKSDNFLNALKKHSEEERNKMLSEMKERTERELETAKAEAEAEAEVYEREHLAGVLSEITSSFAVRSFEAQGELLRSRTKMAEDVFKKAEEKLFEFAASDRYKEKLLKDAEEIAQLFSERECTLNVKPEDMKYEKEIKKLFGKNAKLESDPSIRLGGIRGFCAEMKIVADNTLDSKLEEQKNRFADNADLKIN